MLPIRPSGGNRLEFTYEPSGGGIPLTLVDA